jgi:hypothetical protein
VADINDRLERLSRRDELARRLQQQRSVPAEVVAAGPDFADVVEAVANVVRRHPGMSVMLAPGDGRRGSAVIRIAEQHGEAEVAVVTPPSGAGGAGSEQHDEQSPGIDVVGQPVGAAAGAPAGSGQPAPPPPPPAAPMPQPGQVWHPPGRWQPAGDSDYGTYPGGPGQSDGWRWSG